MGIFRNTKIKYPAYSTSRIDFTRTSFWPSDNTKRKRDSIDSDVDEAHFEEYQNSDNST